VSRVVAVGASNLTRGFSTVVDTARDRWGPGVEIVAALGHGRSYGERSTVVCRTLPGILQSGIWRAVDERPPAPTRALVTDVGNDILYGSPPARVIGWAAECVSRLERFTDDVVITGLPPSSLGGLSPARFVFFRSLLFPRCRLTLAEVLDAAAEVEAGLEALAARRGFRFCRLKPEWYGVDPVHLRPRMWRLAWEEILCGEAAAASGRRGTRLEAARLYCLQPERVTFLGIERRSPQRGTPLRAGGRVWLY